MARFKPVKCDKCKGQDFLRQVAYGDDGEKIEEWYSDNFIVCKKCGEPLHRNKHIIKNHKRVKIPVLSSQIEDFLRDEAQKERFRHADPNLSKIKGKKIEKKKRKGFFEFLRMK